MRPFHQRIRPSFDKSGPPSDGYCRPRFEWHDQGRATDIEVFVPGVEAGGVEMLVDGNDLLITARRELPVLPNWQAANLPAVRLDYRLRVPLPYDVDSRQIRASLDHGVLTIHLEKGADRVLSRRHVA